LKFTKKIIGLTNILFSIGLFWYDDLIKYILILCILTNGVILIKVTDNEFKEGKLIFNIKVQNFQKIFGVTTLLVGLYEFYMFLDFYIGHDYWESYFPYPGLFQLSVFLSFTLGGFFTINNIFDWKELKSLIKSGLEFIKNKL